MKVESPPHSACPLRSRRWFDDPSNPDLTALYLERYTNFGISVEELQSSRPIIGIAQTGSDLTPCNRHHLVLAERVREGVREAGGIPIEFPVHPIQETGRRPTAALDRNLAYLGLVEILFGYPIDGVVLTIGCVLRVRPSGRRETDARRPPGRDGGGYDGRRDGCPTQNGQSAIQCSERRGRAGATVSRRHGVIIWRRART